MTYDLVLVVHLLVAVFVVGPLAITAMHAPSHARAGDLPALRRDLLTTRLYSALTAVGVATGAVLAADRFATDQPWVLASYAVWFVALAAHVAVVGGAVREAVEALEADPAADASRWAGRMAAGAGVASLAWVVLVVLMVVKPGL